MSEWLLAKQQHAVLNIKERVALRLNAGNSSLVLLCVF